MQPSLIGLPICYIQSVHWGSSYWLFNVLGYTTIRLSSWIDNQYALNLHRRWKLVSVYIIVMGMFLLLNYGLMVTAKLLAGASYPFTFSQRRLADSYNCMAGRARHPWLLLANRSMRNTLRLQQKAAALQKENNTARYTALQNQLNLISCLTV